MVAPRERAFEDHRENGNRRHDLEADERRANDLLPETEQRRDAENEQQRRNRRIDIDNEDVAGDSDGDQGERDGSSDEDGADEPKALAWFREISSWRYHAVPRPVKTPAIPQTDPANRQLTERGRAR